MSFFEIDPKLRKLCEQAEQKALPRFQEIDRIAQYNSEKVLSIELFAAAQAITFRDESKLAPATKAVYDLVRSEVAPIDQDIVMHYEMVKCDKMVKSGRVVEAAEAVCGQLK